MHEAIPSRSALRVALRRAAHQLYDVPPLVFPDPFAVRILGGEQGEHTEALHKTATKLAKPHSSALRAFLVARSRYAEDNLALAIDRGVTQYVLLGAGLDTFAHRNPHPHLRVFEVDHPATQAWKRELLTRAELPLPASLTLVPVDFEHPNPDQGLAARLLAAGFDPTQPTFFAWLGVVPYLTLEAFRATVAFLAAQPLGSGLVLDYGLPRASLPPLEQLARDSMASRVQRSGEPFQLFFTPEEIAHELNHPNALNHPAALNQQVAVSHIPSFSHIEDLGSSELNTRYFPDAPANRHPRLRVLGAANRLLTARR